jgi:hypothetical protein
LSQLLREILEIPDEARRQRRLDALFSTFRALGELWSRRFDTRGDSRYTEALRVLAAEHKRPPFEAEITEYIRRKYCLYAPSRTSEWCQKHGFNWLPKARPGRKD